MAFVVKKIIHGKEYFYLNENKRVDGKVKTKTLAYLGKTREVAEKRKKEILNSLGKSNLKLIKPKKNISVLKKVKISVEDMASFCKRKGFVFRSSDIYGGFAGFWDFGPLGAELFNNIKKEWWNYFVRQREDMVGIDASVISHPKTWKASGHVTGFKDVAVICKKCKKSAKLELSEFGKIKCSCGGEYEKLGEFDMLFKTSVGALDKTDAYLRGETAQAMFMNFKLIHQTSRMKLPFGIAQIGKTFRNEIAPRDFLFRLRELHIGELEFFINPEEKKCSLLSREHLNVKLKLLDAKSQEKGNEILKKTTIKSMLREKRFEEWQAYWLAEQIMWLRSLGLEEIKVREHTKDELSHYSSATFDIDYEYGFGSEEIAGNANRGQFDLKQHQKFSKESMEIFDDNTGKKVLPKVIEPTFGMDRIFLALLTKAYNKNEKGDVVLKLPSRLAPIKAAVFPIVKKEKFEKISEKIFNDLKKEFNVVHDKVGSIGKRYARNDEIGTPYCITIDGDSLKNKDATIRQRDTSKQIRVKISELKNTLKNLIEEKIKFEEAGKLIR